MNRSTTLSLVALVSLVWLLSGAKVSAEVRVPRLFGDNMILQQNTRNAVWGFADPDEKVTVTASWGAEVSAVANPQGDWKVLLPTPQHGTGFSLTIRGNNKLEIKNVAIGEVWLCAGQSNMGWALRMTFGGEEEAANADAPGFRIFRSSREHWHKPLKESRDRLAQWKPCNPESAAACSAVSYYFGKKLHDELGIPVGIIQQAYAGTPIEAWMPWEIQKDDPRAQAHRATYQASAERQITRMGKTVDKAMSGYESESREYNALIDSGQTMKNSVKQLAPPTIVQPATLGHQMPGNIFNAMIHPVRPYGIRGMIWYQGERNAKNVPQAMHYRNQLPQMIDFYRKSWHELSEGNTDPKFPCYFTQLPSWNPPQTEPVEGVQASWAVSREMMRLVANECENTGVAVAIDTGDAIQLHPKNKRPIGIRHAYLALKQTYGKDIVDYGPRYRSQQVDGNKLVLTFDSIGGGLVSARDGAIDSFAIAGADKQWHWADAEIKGNTVVLSSPKVAQPIASRYAWAMNPSQRNLLYNQQGLPASPFRTDDWPLFDPDAEIVDVLKPAKAETKATEDWKRPAMTQ
ncbi:MAG: sialate O-acetylesterase [Rubripirellula sp.]